MWVMRRIVRRGWLIGIDALYQAAEMLTHHSLEMLKRGTGLTKVR